MQLRLKIMSPQETNPLWHATADIDLDDYAEMERVDGLSRLSGSSPVRHPMPEFLEQMMADHIDSTGEKRAARAENAA